jgi:hypothetical protein
MFQLFDVQRFRVSNAMKSKRASRPREDYFLGGGMIFYTPSCILGGRMIFYTP